MITATKEELSDGVRLQLKGVLDGSVDYHALVGTLPRRLIVHCAQITHVNSSSIRPWKEFFQWIHDQQGTELVYQECPPAIIDYFNSVNGILCGGRVESVRAYFYCKKCKTETYLCLDTSSPQRLARELQEQKCQTCNGPASFDEIPEDFFAFLGEDFLAALSSEST